MTVAMERFHGGPVGLVVASSRLGDDGRYAREILLTTPAGRIVQHGVVRIDLARLPAATAEAIRRETTPLGRILLAAGLLCEVHDVSLLRIAVGPELAAVCNTAVPAETFGRVATITLDGRPAIELLEIVASGSAELT
jgi:chorismate-pyruvate lyase